MASKDKTVTRPRNIDFIVTEDWNGELSYVFLYLSMCACEFVCISRTLVATTSVR